MNMTEQAAARKATVKAQFDRTMRLIDQSLLDRIGLTHLDMPDLDWWSIVESNEDEASACVEDAMEQWIENGDLPEDAYDW